MESFIETFHIDWKILIAQVINFGVIFLVLYLFALKPIKKIMTERTATIEKGINDAKHNAEIIASTKKEYEEVIAKAKGEAHELFQEGKKEAEAKKVEMLAKAQSEVEAMVESGKKNLENEKAKMVEEAKAEIVSLVVAATEKVLQDKGDAEITEKSIKKVGNM